MLFLQRKFQNGNIMKKLFFIICALLPGIAFPQYLSKEFTIDNSDVINSVALNVSVSNEDSLILLQGSHRASGLFVSGCANLNDEDESYVRITVRDTYNSDYLVYELYPLLTEAHVCPFSKIGLETAYLDNIQVQSIKIETLNASVTLDSVYFVVPERSSRSMRKATLNRKSQCEHIASRLNNRLVGGNKTWRAGVTFISQMTYEEKKGMFGGKVPVLYGFDYYKGGIFVMPGFYRDVPQVSKTRDTDNYVSEWDWRNRHGKNWVTSVKNQNYPRYCGSCWAFAALGVLEAYINLYYNNIIDYDLSEEEIISCSPYGCSGGFEQYAYDFIKTSGIVGEDCFLYVGFEQSCDSMCPNPSERIFIEDYGHYTKTEDSIKRQLFRAPITLGLQSMQHSMTLVGYRTVNAGNNILDSSASMGSVTINPVTHARLIGETIWIVKNSWGDNWGLYGYLFLVFNVNDINSNCYLQGGISSLVLNDNDIICSDADGDGLYFWGIGNKPAHCPSWVPDTPDGDDSDINFGSIDSCGYLDLLPAGITIKTPITYATNSSTSYRLGIVNGGSLTITGTTTLVGESKIRVCEGGILIVDGGILQNADITMVPGSKLIVRNNGIINMATGKNFEAPNGVQVIIERGKIN